MRFALLLLLLTSSAQAAFDIEGFLLDSGGNPIVGTGYQITAAIEKTGDPSCILSREIITGINTGTNGDFIVTVGSGSLSSGFSLSVDSALVNSSTLPCRDESGSLTGSFSPGIGDDRTLWIKFDISGTIIDLGRTRLAPAPYAMNATYLGGHTAQSLLRVSNAGSPYSIPAFSVPEYTELQNLALGTSTNYMRGNVNSGAALPVVSGSAPPSRGAGAIWFDSATGTVKFHNGTTDQTLGIGTASGGTVSSVAAGVGLVATGTNNVVVSLATSGATAGTYGNPTQVPQFNVDNYGRITSISTTNISGVQPGGSAGGDLGGVYPNPIVSALRGVSISATAPTTGQFLRFGGTGWGGAAINLSDLKSSISGNLFPSPACTSNQSLYWDSGTDTIRCQNIQLSGAAITSGTVDGARLPASATYWSSAPGGISYVAGIVGLGTTTPAANLDVSSDGNTTFTLNSFLSSSPRRWNFRTMGSEDGRFSLFDATANAERFVINNNGNVGVGTSFPSAKLEVADGGFRARSSVANTGLVIANTVSTVAQLVGTDATTNDNGALLLRSANTVKLQLKASGESYMTGGPLTIGSNTLPTSVNGPIGGTISPARLNVMSAGGPGIFSISVDDSPAFTGVANGFGSVGHLGYQNWGVLCSYGQCGGNQGWSNTSDIRLKTHIQTASGSLARLLRIRGVTYHWIDRDRDEREGEKLGVIAQEVEKEFPQAIVTDTSDKSLPGGRKMVTYTDLIGPMIEAIKELYGKWEADHARTDQHERALAALKAENTELKKANEAKVNELEARIKRLEQMLTK